MPSCVWLSRDFLCCSKTTGPLGLVGVVEQVVRTKVVNTEAKMIFEAIVLPINIYLKYFIYKRKIISVYL